MKQDIHKSAAIIIKDGKLLITKTKGKPFFVAPGGKLHKEETPETCLKRELKEELGINVRVEDMLFFETYEAVAKGTDNQMLSMDCYIVESYEGIIAPASEIEEVAWIDSQNYRNYEIGSIFRDRVLPVLVEQGVVG
jgi:8-oxo-dGTP pyrophosphatase MutT (NUDIX family)